MRTICVIIFLLMGTASSGCRVGPEHCGPGAPISDSYRQTDSAEVTHEWSDVAQWWFQFEDPTLDQLIDEAAAQNLGLEEAAHRVMEARLQRGVVRTDGLPQIAGDGSYAFQKTAISGGIFGQLGAFGGIDTTIDNFALGLNGAWEIDLFGRIARNVEAADADIGAAVWAYRDTMVILMADVASFYVDARAFQRRLEIAHKNLEQQRRSLEIVEKRREGRLTDDLDVAQTRANLFSSESEIPSLEIGYQQAVNRISVLLGRPPGYVDDLLSQPGPIPRPPMEVAIGIPAELLRRRPDVRRAERELAAQTARIGAAMTEFYPQLTLTGSFGVNSQDVSSLFNTNSIAANVGPAVNWNILNFGRIRFNVAVQEERALQNLIRYESTVLGAAEQVDNALVAYDREKRRVVSIGEAVTSYRRAEEIMLSRVEVGRVDELRLIDTQRQLFQFEDQMIASQANVTKNLIELYRALGGGWEWAQGEIYAQGPVESIPESEPDDLNQPMEGESTYLPYYEPDQFEAGHSFPSNPDHSLIPIGNEAQRGESGNGNTMFQAPALGPPQVETQPIPHRGFDSSAVEPSNPNQTASQSPFRRIGGLQSWSTPQR